MTNTDHSHNMCCSRLAPSPRPRHNLLRAVRENEADLEPVDPEQKLGSRARKILPGPSESERQPMPSDSLNALSKRELVILLRQKERRFDAVDLGQLYGATCAWLTVLRTRTREGKCVQEASELARWVSSGGLLKLFAAFPQPAPHEVSAEKLATLARDTLFECEAQWKGRPGTQQKWVELSEVEMLNSKLNSLAQMVAGMAPRTLPELRVLEPAAIPERVSS